LHGQELGFGDGQLLRVEATWSGVDGRTSSRDGMVDSMWRAGCTKGRLSDLRKVLQEITEDVAISHWCQGEWG
jgi:hypothetical protein